MRELQFSHGPIQLPHVSDSTFSPVSTTPVDHITPTTCAFCRQPIAQTHYRLAGRIACPSCAEKISAAIDEKHRFALRPWLLGASAGIGVAIACAIVWALIAKA